MSEIMKDKATHLAKNRGSVSSLESHEIRAKDFFGRYKDSVSTVSYMDEHGHHEDSLRPAIQLENTYQLGPTKYFPITAVNNILKDVVVSYLQEEQYEAELCRQMTKTISEVQNYHESNKSQDKRPDGTKIQNYCDYIHWTAR